MGSRVISAVLTLKDKDFSSNIARAAARADDLGRGVAHVGNTIQRFGRSATDAFKNVARSAANVSFAGMAAGAAALSAGVVSQIIEMDDAFGRLEARTGATGAELKGLESVAKDVFRAGFGESLTQVADDVATLSATFDNLNDKQLTEVAKGAATIGKAWGFEVKEVGKAVSTMTKTFDGLSESKALDLMTTAFQETGDMSDDLLDTFNEYSTQFKALGYDAEGFTATLIAGAKSGAFNFDKLADSAKEGFLKLGEGSKDTTEALKLMGLDADQVMKDIATGGEDAQKAFMAVSTAIGTIEDPAERNAAAIAAFGTPLEDLGPQFQTFFSDVNQDMGNFEGATQRAADAMQNSFGSRMTQVWRDLKLSIAEMASDGSGKEFLDGLASTAESLVPKIQELVQKALDFAGTIRDNWTPIKETVIGIGTAVGTFALVMGGLKVVSFITTLINGFKLAMQAATIGQWAMNTAMLASPMTWVAAGIAAVVAAGVLLYRNWDTVKKKAGELWAKLQDNPLLALVAGPFGAIIGAVAALSKHFGSVKKVFNEFKNAITSFKVPKWVSTIGGAISGAASKVKDMLPSFDVGTNKVASDMTANIHKGEMIIPARQAERLRQQGVNINNIDKVKGGKGSGGNTTTTTTTVTNSNTRAKNNVNVNIYSNGTTTAQVIKEIVPQLKLVLANL